MKPAGRGFSVRPRGVRRRSIHDPRSMHFAVGVGRERCIKTRPSTPAVVDDPAAIAGGSTSTYQPVRRESPQINGIATPVHTVVQV